ncbi:hypothetical protein HL667_09460 [Bradyrhizobium sp. 83012]|uniref:Uncharacterized protein n=1 Tax=Bradyrhizobium aeschynomenes TaxID=2734909 RepID=A0ABX2CC32_9BRAD|nr:hypothetical protein [Bradyrhizobium aeschynomenes]NPU65220.1 hypothetical protein [Bradyrhizobium aeschynomenes]
MIRLAARLQRHGSAKPREIPDARKRRCGGRQDWEERIPAPAFDTAQVPGARNLGGADAASISGRILPDPLQTEAASRPTRSPGFAEECAGSGGM